MSAIWGIISRKSTDQTSRFQKMTEVMKRYKIDRFEEVGKDTCFMGCGHQYFTEEAVTDQSPIYDEEKGIYFAGDCFLYNREDIFTYLKELAPFWGEEGTYHNESHDLDLLDSKTQAQIGDSKLAYLLYQRMGLSFVNKLRGSFSFAIFEEKAGKLHLFTDHFCKRYLAYHIAEDYIAFASCYKPILEAGDHNFTLSKKSIIYAYSNMTPLNFREPEITPFEEIFHLEASMHYTIDLTKGSIEKKQYWTPRENVKKLKGLKDEEYKQLFVETYKKVCIDHLRSRKETGIMLSGGLDSASVLAMVAPKLKSEGKKIFSYTTVPCDGFKPIISYSMIEDESFLIKAQQKYHSNLEPRYINCDNENCLIHLAKYQEQYDLPIKAVINNNNVVKMGDAARKDDCLILLGGGNGNATVSFGYATNFVGLSLHQGKIVTAIKEINTYCKKAGISRMQMFKDFLKDLWNYAFVTQNIGQYFISKENRKKYEVEKALKKNKRDIGSAFVTSEKQKLNFMYIPTQYIQKSFYYTINSLEQGYLQLDPTLSVEIVELCMSLPNQCFVKDGVERRLIRDYMKELLPPVITDMRKGYGVQASDFAFRINRDWDSLKDEIMPLLKDPLLYEYLDKNEVEELIENMEKTSGNFAWNTAWFLSIIASLGYFLRGHKEYLPK